MASPLAAVRARSIRAADSTPDVAPPHLALGQPPTAKVDDGREFGSCRDRTVLGMSALLLSTILFPLADMISKVLAETYSGLQVTWFRYVVLLLVIGPAIARRPDLIRTARPYVQIARGISSATATSLALVGFMFLPVADATAIGFCAPLIVTALAAWILKEYVGWSRWGAAAIGFVGILIIVQPGPGTFHVATLLPLLSSLFSALTVITTRFARDQRVETTVALSALVGFAVMSAVVVTVWKPLDTHAVQLGLVMGALAAAASILQVVAYRCAPSSLLAPFSYAQILWATGFGWLVFGTVPGFAMMAGSAIVIASGCAAALQVGGSRQRDWPAVRRELMRLDPTQRPRAA